MNKKIISAIIAAAMILSVAALSGCESKVEVNVSDSTSSSAAASELESETDNSEASAETDSEESTSSDESKNSSSMKDDTKSKKSESSKAASSKAATSKAASSKSESSKTASEGLTDDEALEIVLNNTDYTKDELLSVATNEEDGEKFHNVSFFRNGTYVFYVRDRDKKFFTYEEYNSEYYGDTSLGIDEKRALAIVLQNTDYTEDELVGNTLITEDGDNFYSVGFYRNGTYVFYVRVRDGKFFTYEDFNKAYYNSESPETTEEEDALATVLENTDYTEDELLGISENEADGDKFYNIAFFRNGTYVFYVRQRDGRFYTSEDFNKGYNEYYDGYIGHD